MKHRRFKLHLIGPAPWGGTYHTADAKEAVVMLRQGYRLYRINIIPPIYWRDLG